jgi:hypothetical protein
MRPERRSAAGMKGGVQPPLAPFWGKAVNPGSARAAPSQWESFIPYDCAAVFVRQLRGPHFSTFVYVAVPIVWCGVNPDTASSIRVPGVDGLPGEESR